MARCLSITFDAARKLRHYYVYVSQKTPIQSLLTHKAIAHTTGSDGRRATWTGGAGMYVRIDMDRRKHIHGFGLDKCRRCTFPSIRIHSYLHVFYLA